MTCKKQSVELSIVIPVYHGEAFLNELTEKLHTNLKPIVNSYEILLVDDRSPDNSWQLMESIAKKEDSVKAIRLSKNFGQHYAITAGLFSSQGNWIVVMDCDLQDRPEEIPNLYSMRNDSDVILALRENRQDSFIKKLNSKAFYKVFNYLTDTSLDYRVGNFGIYNRKVIDSILSMNDHIRYFPAMANWVGFNKKYLEVEHVSRFSGRSSYSFTRLIILAYDNIIGFSEKPLWYSVKLGISMSAVSLFIAFFYLLQYLQGEIKVLGFASLILSIWFIGGLILFSLGVLGIYVGKVFKQTKNRPHYIIDEII